MAHPHTTPGAAPLEEAITLLFRLVDDAYATIDPRWRSHESLKKLSDSEVLTLALFQQLRGVESERSFLRDVQRFFVHLFPGVARTRPSSLHRRVRRLRRFWSPCAARSCPNWSATPRPSSSTRRFWKCAAFSIPCCWRSCQKNERYCAGRAGAGVTSCGPDAAITECAQSDSREGPEYREEKRDASSMRKRKGTHLKRRRFCRR